MVYTCTCTCMCSMACVLTSTYAYQYLIYMYMHVSWAYFTIRICPLLIQTILVHITCFYSSITQYSRACSTHELHVHVDVCSLPVMYIKVCLTTIPIRPSIFSHLLHMYILYTFADNRIGKGSKEATERTRTQHSSRVHHLLVPPSLLPLPPLLSHYCSSFKPFLSYCLTPSHCQCVTLKVHVHVQYMCKYMYMYFLLLPWQS